LRLIAEKRFDDKTNERSRKNRIGLALLYIVDSFLEAFRVQTEIQIKYSYIILSFSLRFLLSALRHVQHRSIGAAAHVDGRKSDFVWTRRILPQSH